MATSPVSFYLDESLSPEIATQLSMRGIDIIRGPLGDDDFLKLAAPGVEHAGIIKGIQHRHSIGDWIRFLRYVDAVANADEMRNKVTYLFRVD